MKKIEFKIAFNPENNKNPHAISWASYIDFPYPLENWFDTLVFTFPDFTLPIGDGLKINTRFMLGNTASSGRRIESQSREEPTLPPKDPPYDPNPEKPYPIPDEPPLSPPSEDPEVTPPRVPERPEPTKLILYMEILLALLTIRALSKIALAKSN